MNVTNTEMCVTSDASIKKKGEKEKKKKRKKKKKKEKEKRKTAKKEIMWKQNILKSVFFENNYVETENIEIFLFLFFIIILIFLIRVTGAPAGSLLLVVILIESIHRRSVQFKEHLW